MKIETNHDGYETTPVVIDEEIICFVLEFNNHSLS